MSDDVAVEQSPSSVEEESKHEDHTDAAPTADAAASPSTAPSDSPSTTTSFSANPSRSKRLFIGQMAYETTDATLQREMSKFGTVTDSIVMKEKGSGRSRGFGFVSFAELDSVDKLLHAAGSEEGYTIDNRRILVTVADARGGGDGGGKPGGFRGGGGDIRDIRDVRDARFRGDSRDVRSGDVRDVRSQRTYDSDKSIIQSRHRGGGGGKVELDPRFPDDRGTADAGVPLQRRKLFIGNVSHSTTQQQYEEFFSQYGKIEDAVIIVDMATGKRKGFGFVTYTSSEAADRARHAGRFQYLVDRTVEVKAAIPPDEIARLDAEHSERERQRGGHDASSSRGRYRRSRSPPQGNYRRGGGGRDARDRDQRRRYSRSRSRSADRYGGGGDAGAAAAAMDPNAMMQQYMMFMQMMQAQNAGMTNPIMPAGYNPGQPAMPYAPTAGYNAPLPQQPSPMMSMPQPPSQHRPAPPQTPANDPSQQQYSADAYMQAYQQWMQSQQQQQTSAPVMPQQQPDPQYSAMQSQLTGLGSYLNQLNDPHSGGQQQPQQQQQTYGQYNQMQQQQHYR